MIRHQVAIETTILSRSLFLIAPAIRMPRGVMLQAISVGDHKLPQLDKMMQEHGRDIWAAWGNAM
jgi:hypothetical protein